MFNPQQSLTWNYKLFAKRRKNRTYYYYRSLTSLMRDEEAYRKGCYRPEDVRNSMPIKYPLLRDLNSAGIFRYVDNYFRDEALDPNFFKNNPNFMPFLSLMGEIAIDLLHLNHGALFYMKNKISSRYTKMQFNVDICNEMNRLINQQTGDIKPGTWNLNRFNLLFACYIILPYF